MQLRDIAWASVKRRRGRFVFALAAVALGIGTVVALVSLSRAMRAEVGDELDRFGANIVITPKARSLDVAYGGVAVAGLTVDAQELHTRDADAIRTIPNRRNVSAVAPKLVGTLEIEGQRALLIGVRFRDEGGVKSWWKIEGRLARNAGADASCLRWPPSHWGSGRSWRWCRSPALCGQRSATSWTASAPTSSSRQRAGRWISPTAAWPSRA